MQENKDNCKHDDKLNLLDKCKIKHKDKHQVQSSPQTQAQVLAQAQSRVSKQQLQLQQQQLQNHQESPQINTLPFSNSNWIDAKDIIDCWNQNLIQLSNRKKKKNV